MLSRFLLGVATTAGYLLRIDCWEAEKGIKLLLALNVP